MTVNVHNYDQVEDLSPCDHSITTTTGQSSYCPRPKLQKCMVHSHSCFYIFSVLLMSPFTNWTMGSEVAPISQFNYLLIAPCLLYRSEPFQYSNVTDLHHNCEYKLQIESAIYRHRLTASEGADWQHAHEGSVECSQDLRQNVKEFSNNEELQDIMYTGGNETFSTAATVSVYRPGTTVF